MSQGLKIPVLALAQLNRANEKEDRLPVLSDLRDSGSIEQDADIVIMLHNPDLGKNASQPPPSPARIEALVRKNRHGEGNVGVLLKYYKGTQMFTD